MECAELLFPSNGTYPVHYNASLAPHEANGSLIDINDKVKGDWPSSVVHADCDTCDVSETVPSDKQTRSLGLSGGILLAFGIGGGVFFIATLVVLQQYLDH